MVTNYASVSITGTYLVTFRMMGPGNIRLTEDYSLVLLKRFGS